MLRVALGFRMHSGWGVMVALDQNHSIVQRDRVELVDDQMPGGRQPYHYAKELGLQPAESYLMEYIMACDGSARKWLKRTLSNLKTRDYRVAGAGIVLASPRRLPPLSQILAAHPLIHTAEGNLFREVIRRSCESAGIPVLGLPEREIEAQAQRQLGSRVEALKEMIETSGRSLGPPWNSDHKRAATAACLALHEFGAR